MTMHKACRGPLALLLALSPVLCSPDEVANRGQEILDRNRQAVVTVQVVLKTSYSKDGQTASPTETRYELTGTVVDPSGLTAVAASGCDPAEFYRKVVPGYADYKVQSEITSLKILLGDGTELPAEVVLRDKDLDLAFVRPKVALGRSITAVDIAKCAPAKALEQVVALNRLNAASGRAYSACAERIMAVVTKPRPYYLHDGTSEGTKLGCPVFSLNGDIIGLIVMRVGGALVGDYRENAASIIIPATDVLKAAKQVPPVENHAANKAQSDSAKPQN